MESTGVQFEFEKIENCPVCGWHEEHDAKGVSWRGVAFSYALCTRCGLKYMRPRPTRKTFEFFYVNHYWQQQLSASGYANLVDYGDKKIDQRAYRMAKYKNVYTRLKRDLQKVIQLNSASRVLEVGCAFGYSLEWLAKDFGCQVFGIEPSEEAVKRCEEANVPIIAPTAEEFFDRQTSQSSKEKYDVIFFRQCLESLPRPKEVLLGVREKLSENGILLIYTVNVEYYDAMDPYHAILYSPRTLSQLLALCGLEVFKIDATPSPVNHKIAVKITRPSYQFVVFAKKGIARELPYEKVDPSNIARMHELGKEVMAWRQLSIKDLFLRILCKWALKIEDIFRSRNA